MNIWKVGMFNFYGTIMFVEPWKTIYFHFQEKILDKQNGITSYYPIMVYFPNDCFLLLKVVQE